MDPALPSATRPTTSGAPPPRARTHRPRRRRRTTKRWVAIGALITTLATVIWIESGPVYRVLQRWQARNIVSQAEELARQQAYSESLERLDVALRLDPESADGLRTLAAIYSQFDLPYALPAWRSLLALPGHRIDDVHAYIDLAVRLQRFDLAEAELARLLSAQPVTERTRIQAAEFHFRQGHIDRAVEFAEKIAEAHPGEPVHAVRLARMLLAHPEPGRREAGLQVILHITSPEPRDRIALLQALAGSSATPTASWREALAHLAPPESASATECLVHADARLRVDPQQRDVILRDTVARLRNAPPEQQAELVAWLNRNGAAETAATLHAIGNISTLPPVLLAHLEALARTERWQDLKSATAAPLPLEGWALHGFRALAAERLREESFAREHWRRSLEDASSSPARMRSLGDLALRLNWTEKAIEAYHRLTRDRLYRLTGYRRLAQAYERSHDTQRLRAIMREWSAHVPDDPIPDHTFCYLSALLRMDVGVATDRARRLFERLPDRFGHRATLAWLECRRNQPLAGLQLIERAPDSSGDTVPASRIARAAVLHANGRTSQARLAIEGLEESQLLPEERDLVHRIQRGE